MPTKKQLSESYESQMEFPETRRTDDPMYKKASIPSYFTPDSNDMVEENKPDKINKLLQAQIEECRVYIDRRSRDFGQSSYELNKWFGEIKPIDWHNENVPVEESKELLIHVLDNCNAFRNWLTENNIPFIANGAFTSFDLSVVDIFSVGKQFGIYEYLNKPKEESKEPDEIDEDTRLEFAAAILANKSPKINSLVDKCVEIAKEHTNSKLQDLEKWVDENKTTFIDGYETVPAKILKEKITFLKQK